MDHGIKEKVLKGWYKKFNLIEILASDNAYLSAVYIFNGLFA